MVFDKGKHYRLHEFQAVVLAGYGSSNSSPPPCRLYPIAEEDNMPKALLPVANKPIIAYTLDWLEKAGIHDALIVVQASGNAHQKIAGYLARGYQGNVHCNVISVEEDFGSADALRALKDKIDVSKDSTMTALFYEPSTTEGASKEDELLPFVGIDSARGALVYKTHRSEDEDFSMRMSLLTKFPRVSVHTDLQDAHLYIFKRWVLDMVADKESISSISEDLIPLLVKCQYQKKMVEREMVEKYAANNKNLLSTALALSTTLSEGVSDDFSSGSVLSPGFKSPVKTYVFIYRGGFCGRGNTIASYSELNRHAIKQGEQIVRIAPTTEVAAKTQVGNDSIIGEYTKIDERSSIKKSCVGAHCVIGKNVKIANSVIMDHVVIADNAKVDGCVICNNAKVLEKASLKDCDVAAQYVVEKESQVKGEKLVSFREAI
ncbi:nucleotide-diphospho-sugar transferase [Spinellus fusiger]|nr:nucleotide-diphospho-sugar transferase [Spinellus fusiger]